MTNFQRHLFNEILDLNWELEVGDYNEIVTKALRYRMQELERELEEDMGVEEWKNFKEQGRRMFKPA